MSEKDKKGVLLIGGVSVAVLSVLAIRVWLGYSPKPGDDNCIGRVTASTVIVVDHTERTTVQTRKEIVARALKHVHENVAENERVSLFNIAGDSSRALLPTFSACRPPETGNRITTSTKTVERRYRDSFWEPLSRSLETVPADSPESPLAQAITDLSLSYYLRAEKNTLLVFSDLLENTGKFSLYQCSSAEQAIPQYRAARHGAVERPRLKNTRVHLNVIPRFDIPSAALQCRDRLWNWFFGDAEGERASVTLDYLPGGDTR